MRQSRQHGRAGARDTDWGREMGKKVAEAEARAKQEAAAHGKRVAQLEEELSDVRRFGSV